MPSPLQVVCWCLALLCASQASGAPNLRHTKEEAALLKWVVANGAQLKVTIGRNEEGVRGLFTTEDVTEGEALLDIPEYLILSVKNVGAAEAAPVLLKEINTPCSRLKPYMDILPAKDEVLTGYNWPAEYLKHLSSVMLEQQVTDSFQRHVRDVFKGAHNDNMEMTIAEAIGNVNITYDHYMYITALLTSRTFSIRKAALSMVPVADLANHDVREINKLDNANKPGFRIMAGKNLTKGEEVTITYGAMRNDELMMYYGFLDEFTEPPKLCAIDHPSYVQYETDSDALGDTLFTGTTEEMTTEVDRLQNLLLQMDAELEEAGPMPNTIPYMVELLTKFHDKRRRALQHEISRLQGQISQAPHAEL